MKQVLNLSNNHTAIIEVKETIQAPAEISARYDELIEQHLQAQNGTSATLATLAKQDLDDYGSQLVPVIRSITSITIMNYDDDTIRGFIYLTGADFDKIQQAITALVLQPAFLPLSQTYPILNEHAWQ